MLVRFTTNTGYPILINTDNITCVTLDPNNEHDSIIYFDHDNEAYVKGDITDIENIVDYAKCMRCDDGCSTCM